MTTALVIFGVCTFFVVVGAVVLYAIGELGREVSNEDGEDPIEAEYRVESIRGRLE